MGFFKCLIQNGRLKTLDHRNPRSYVTRSMFEKRENDFQLISALFCEVKRGFVESCKNVPMQ
jgi:hypothetical protein